VLHQDDFVVDARQGEVVVHQAGGHRVDFVVDEELRRPLLMRMDYYPDEVVEELRHLLVMRMDCFLVVEVSALHSPD
jgi:hypothetical protein